MLRRGRRREMNSKSRELGRSLKRSSLHRGWELLRNNFGPQAATKRGFGGIITGGKGFKVGVLPDNALSLSSGAHRLPLVPSFHHVGKCALRLVERTARAWKRPRYNVKDM